MGQAWCKEKSSKAQDSKSPLDRVFVRCAHRIYPSLKEEGSVLGGSATQRVTSSEIGYAASAAAPPRAGLLRGQSIDSVDRPFHPSEWVDVNLEVPCTPRASVVLAAPGQQRARSPRTDGQRRSQTEDEEEEGGPVPPPRRRRRRARRSLPADDESEPEPELASSSTDNCFARGFGREDNDDEPTYGKFSQIDEDSRRLEQEPEVTFEKCKLAKAPKTEAGLGELEQAPVVEQRLEDESFAELEVVKRPSRHVKTSSLTRDTASTPAAEQPNPKGQSFAEEEARSGKQEDRASSPGDKSIFKIDTSANCSASTSSSSPLAAEGSLLGALLGLQTSTPVKAAIDEEDPVGPRQNLDDTFKSFRDDSSKSRDSSSVEASPGVGPAQEVHQPPRRNDQEEEEEENDVGYASRTSGHLFSDESSSGAADELSSGIVKDGIVSSSESDSLRNENISGLAAVQRTISEESLPREMLAEELDEEDEQQQQPVAGPSDSDKSNPLDAANRLTSSQPSLNDSVNFKTPPPSPESKAHAPNDSSVMENGVSDPSESREALRSPATGALSFGEDGYATSMTPSLMELEAALTDMLEKKDGEPTRAAEPQDKSPDKLAEPQIVVSAPAELRLAGDLTAEERTTTTACLIDFPGAASPFDDSEHDYSESNGRTEEPGERPRRPDRASSSEEQLVVPTPPRRRHRSKSNLNSPAEPEALHTYANARDRLI